MTGNFRDATKNETQDREGKGVAAAPYLPQSFGNHASVPLTLDQLTVVHIYEDQTNFIWDKLIVDQAAVF